jgi:hypothetical protein
LFLDDFFIGDGFRRAVYFKGIPTVKHSVALDDFEDLIDKIGHQEDVKIQVKEKTDVVNEGNMSVLDDIFSSSDKSKQKRRRPPQKHRKSKVEHLDNESFHNHLQHQKPFDQPMKHALSVVFSDFSISLGH